ncbi:MAG: tRNA 2-thiouridine(34) synthase MnmA [Desulfobacterales bacterium]|nr:MAG: tRNA 2-thiouridine(34) synthase MnmA [Desulfobacterales bacterium]
MKKTTAVALSGGVDSLMAAFLLKAQGHPVIGIHFITGYENDPFCQNRSKSYANHKIHHLGRQLGIAVTLLDCRIEFEQQVVDYFTDTYLAGQTPNPCMVCNPAIKFGAVLSYVRQLGADYLATGHYARIARDSAGNFHLRKGVDAQKDQSYFLARLTQEQLARARFPLGGMTKREVKRQARAHGLQPVVERESQDVCFIKRDSYSDFLTRQRGLASEPGPIEDVEGKILGRHNGLHLFTIGQRRGINCPAAEPYYVIRIDRKNNRLVVGLKKDLLSTACRVVDINWINAAPAAAQKVLTRVRYRHKEVPSVLLPVDPRTAIVRFDTAQEAVTPGQGAVFYREDEILGGGWIDGPDKNAPSADNTETEDQNSAGSGTRGNRLAADFERYCRPMTDHRNRPSEGTNSQPVTRKDAEI